jgi:hypothetical protein
MNKEKQQFVQLLKPYQAMIDLCKACYRNEVSYEEVEKKFNERTWDI